MARPRARGRRNAPAPGPRRLASALDRFAELHAGRSRRWDPPAGPLPGVRGGRRHTLRRRMSAAPPSAGEGMTRREAWLSALVVLIAVLLTRVWVATQITFPRPEDTAYYVDVARNLLAGHGLT